MFKLDLLSKAALNVRYSLKLLKMGVVEGII